MALIGAVVVWPHPGLGHLHARRRLGGAFAAQRARPEGPDAAEKPIDNRQLAALVVVTAENGVSGFAEANANPAAVKAYIDSGIGLLDNWDDAPRPVLARCDARDPAGTWEALSASSFWSARAGIGYVALAALGTAI